MKSSWGAVDDQAVVRNPYRGSDPPDARRGPTSQGDIPGFVACFSGQGIGVEFVGIVHLTPTRSSRLTICQHYEGRLLSGRRLWPRRVHRRPGHRQIASWHSCLTPTRSSHLTISLRQYCCRCEERCPCPRRVRWCSAYRRRVCCPPSRRPRWWYRICPDALRVDVVGVQSDVHGIVACAGGQRVGEDCRCSMFTGVRYPHRGPIRPDPLRVLIGQRIQIVEVLGWRPSARQT